MPNYQLKFRMGFDRMFGDEGRVNKETRDEETRKQGNKETSGTRGQETRGQGDLHYL